MTVLFWSENFTPAIGGAEIWGSRFVQALIRLGHRVQVVTGSDPDGRQGRDGEAAITVHRFPFRESLVRPDGSGFRDLRARVAELKRAFQPDVVHLSSLGPSLLYHVVTRKAWHVPTLVTVHGWMRRRPSPGTLLRRVLTEADWIVGVSRFILRETVDLAPIAPERASVIYHGIECDPAGEEPPSLESPTLVCLGRLVRDKGFDVALDAMAHLRALVPGIRLVVAGAGPEGEALRRQARELMLADRVEFAGAVLPADVPPLLKRASLVLVPSRTEAFGLVALEAAAAGRPVVASEVGGLPEVVESEKTGVLVKPDHPASLARAVLGLLSSPARLRAMGVAARARAIAVFPWRVCVDSYLERYAAMQRMPR